MQDDILFFSSYSSSSVAFYFSMLHVKAADVLSFFVQKNKKLYKFSEACGRVSFVVTCCFLHTSPSLLFALLIKKRTIIERLTDCQLEM